MTRMRAGPGRAALARRRRPPRAAAVRLPPALPPPPPRSPPPPRRPTPPPWGSQAGSPGTGPPPGASRTKARGSRGRAEGARGRGQAARRWGAQQGERRTPRSAGDGPAPGRRGQTRTRRAPEWGEREEGGGTRMRDPRLTCSTLGGCRAPPPTGRGPAHPSFPHPHPAPSPSRHLFTGIPRAPAAAGPGPHPDPRPVHPRAPRPAEASCPRSALISLSSTPQFR